MKLKSYLLLMFLISFFCTGTQATDLKFDKIQNPKEAYPKSILKKTNQSDGNEQNELNVEKRVVWPDHHHSFQPISEIKLYQKDKNLDKMASLHISEIMEEKDFKYMTLEDENLLLSPIEIDNIKLISKKEKQKVKQQELAFSFIAKQMWKEQEEMKNNNFLNPQKKITTHKNLKTEKKRIPSVFPKNEMEISEKFDTTNKIIKRLLKFSKEQNNNTPQWPCKQVSELDRDEKFFGTEAECADVIDKNEVPLSANIRWKN